MKEKEKPVAQPNVMSGTSAQTTDLMAAGPDRSARNATFRCSFMGFPLFALSDRGHDNEIYSTTMALRGRAGYSQVT